MTRFASVMGHSRVLFCERHTRESGGRQLDSTTDRHNLPSLEIKSRARPYVYLAWYPHARKNSVVRTSAIWTPK